MKEHRLISGISAWAEKFSRGETNYLPEYIKAGKIKAFIGFGFNMLIWPQTRRIPESQVEGLEFSMAVNYFYSARPIRMWI